MKRFIMITVMIIITGLATWGFAASVITLANSQNDNPTVVNTAP